MNGGNLYRKTTFLVDSLGKEVFSPQRATSRSARSSRRAWRARRSTRKAWRRASARIVRDGVLEGYFLGSYSARKLGMKSTGNAGGHHNLVVRSERARISPAC